LSFSSKSDYNFQRHVLLFLVENGLKLDEAKKKQNHNKQYSHKIQRGRSKTKTWLKTRRCLATLVLQYRCKIIIDRPRKTSVAETPLFPVKTRLSRSPAAFSVTTSHGYTITTRKRSREAALMSGHRRLPVISYDEQVLSAFDHPHIYQHNELALPQHISSAAARAFLSRILTSPFDLRKLYQVRATRAKITGATRAYTVKCRRDIKHSAVSATVTFAQWTSQRSATCDM